LLLSGGGTCEAQPLRKFTTVSLDQDESTLLQASETTELLHYGLPDLTGLSASDHTSGVMQAAE
jgi:predicted component of type VI protein secretion system